MQLRRAPRKSLEKPSKKVSHKSLDRPASRVSDKSLERPSKKTHQKNLDKPTRKASQKNLQQPPSKSSQKSLGKPSRRASQKSIKEPSRKTSQKSLKEPSRKTSQKSLKEPSRKTSQKTLKEPSRKTSQKTLMEPSRKTSQKVGDKPLRKSFQKSFEMPPSKVSQSVKKPSRKASQKNLKMPTSKISWKNLKSNSKADVLAPEKSLERNSKALVFPSQKNLEISTPSASCGICKRNFTSKKLLNEHITKHHFFRHCPNCPKTFQKTRKFIFHLRSHLEDHPYECKICLESFNQKRDLLAHKVVHKRSSRLYCDICSEVFPHLASLHRHRLSHYGPPYPCDDCGAIFSNIPDRTVHSKNHVFRCILCPREVVAFPSNVDLVAHMYRVHQMEEYNSAESEVMDTSESYASTGAVNLEDDGSDSMEEFSSDNESDPDLDSNYQKDAVEPVYNLKHKDKFICFICYDLYPSCELLKSHMKAHNWYPCNSCSRFFPGAEKLKNHECDFAKVPTFRCKNCNFECVNCKRNFKTGDNISEMNMNALKRIAPKFPNTPTLVIDYTDVAQRNCLISFIDHVESQKGLVDHDTSNLVGFHITNLTIILTNPFVYPLFPRHFIPGLEELYYKFVNLKQKMEITINELSAHNEDIIDKQ